jgi:hypothetical protein
MKATKAYIASLGTTGVLLAAALLMLAVVSAVVAFDRWPNGNVSTRVQTLVLADRPAPIRVSARGNTAAGAQSRAPGSSSAVQRGRVPSATVRRFNGRAPASVQQPSSNNPLKALPPAVAGPLAPVQETADPIISTISNPATTAGQVADGAQAVTDSTGVSLGRVSPQLGGAVTNAGETAAATIRDVPLPGHLLPGH